MIPKGGNWFPEDVEAVTAEPGSDGAGVPEPAANKEAATGSIGRKGSLGTGGREVSDTSFGEGTDVGKVDGGGPDGAVGIGGSGKARTARCAADGVMVGGGSGIGGTRHWASDCVMEGGGIGIVTAACCASRGVLRNGGNGTTELKGGIVGVTP